MDFKISKRVNYVSFLDMLSEQFPEINNTRFKNENNHLFSSKEIKQYKYLMNLDLLKSAFIKEVDFGAFIEEEGSIFSESWLSIEKELQERMPLDSTLLILKEIEVSIENIQNRYKLDVSNYKNFTVYLVKPPMSGLRPFDNSAVFSPYSNEPVELVLCNYILWAFLSHNISLLTESNISFERVQYLANYLISNSGEFYRLLKIRNSCIRKESIPKFEISDVEKDFLQNYRY